MDLKDTMMVSAIVGDTELAPQAVERQDVGNPIRIEVDRSIAKIGLRRGGHSTTVAVDMNGFLGRADVVDVRRVGEEVNRQLAVEENKIRVNGRPWNILGQQKRQTGINGGGVSLREDNNTLVIAGHRSIISRSRHGMNLGRWFIIRANA
jgi:hypothetical protein